jgi:hypothetical protein
VKLLGLEQTQQVGKTNSKAEKGTRGLSAHTATTVRITNLLYKVRRERRIRREVVKKRRRGEEEKRRRVSMQCDLIQCDIEYNTDAI